MCWGPRGVRHHALQLMWLCWVTVAAQQSSWAVFMCSAVLQLVES